MLYPEIQIPPYPRKLQVLVDPDPRPKGHSNPTGRYSTRILLVDTDLATFGPQDLNTAYGRTVLYP